MLSCRRTVLYLDDKKYKDMDNFKLDIKKNRTVSAFKIIAIQTLKCVVK